MSRAAVAMALSALRRLAVASRPMNVARAISTAPVTIGRPLPLFRPSPMFLFPREVSYAHGRRSLLGNDSDDEYLYDDSDEEDLYDDTDFNDKDLDLGSNEDMSDESVESESE